MHTFCVAALRNIINTFVAGLSYSMTIQNGAKHHFGLRLITAAASQGLAAGILLADRAEASPTHRSGDSEPPASFHCKHSGVRSSWNGATAHSANRGADKRRTKINCI